MALVISDTDGGDGAKGFKRTAGLTGDHYLYDLNGNMTQDKHKGFVFTYNYLNLPNTMTKGASVITMTYTADGEKLSKAVTGGGATKNYVAGIEYSGANLEAIFHAEGRLTPNGANFYYEYTLKDQLGNARISYRAITNGTAIQPLQENHYYPFGMEMEGSWLTQVGTENQYEYNGKEYNEDFGLNLSDYGARWYDASVGRWWNVEPLADYLPNQSSYLYGANNPISYVDIDGFLQFPPGATVIIDGVEKTYEEAFPEFTRYLRGGVAEDGTKYGLSEFIKSSIAVNSGLKVIGGYSDETISNFITNWGSGIVINIMPFEGNGTPGPEFNGHTLGGINKLFDGTMSPGNFNLDQNLVLQYENAQTEEERTAALLAVISTVLHECIHVGELSFSREENLKAGYLSRKTVFSNSGKKNIKFYYKNKEFGGLGSEGGRLFESSVWFKGNRFDETLNRKQPINGGINFQLQIIQNTKDRRNIPKPPYNGA